MGLSLSVGMLADLLVNDEEGGEWLQGEIKTLNALLQRSGLQPHIEPRELLEGADFSGDMGGYSPLHKLRRLAVHLSPRKTWLGSKSGRLPPPIGDDAVNDPLLKALYEDGRSLHPDSPFHHLIDHSDAEGFYVPQEFKRVLTDEALPGGYVGSAHRLRAECLDIALALGLPSDLDPESDAVLEAMEASNPKARGWEAYGVESYACLMLLRATEVSLKTGALIVFT